MDCEIEKIMIRDRSLIGEVSLFLYVLIRYYIGTKLDLRGIYMKRVPKVPDKCSQPQKVCKLLKHFNTSSSYFTLQKYFLMRLGVRKLSENRTESI